MALIFGALFLHDDTLLYRWAGRFLHVEPEQDAVGMLASAFWPIVAAFTWTAQRELVSRYLRRLEQITAPVADTDPIAMAWTEICTSLEVAHVERDCWGYLQRMTRARCYHERSGVSEASFSHWQIGAAHLFLGQLERADEELARALDMRPPASLDALCTLCCQAILRNEQRRHADAAILAAGLMRQTTDLHLLRDGRLYWTEAKIHLGELDAAEAGLSELRQQETHPYVGIFYAALLGRLRLAQGRAAEVVERIEDAHARLQRHGMGHFFRYAAFLLVRAEVREVTGDHAGACAAIEEARADLLRRAAKIPDLEVRRCFLENLPDHRRTVELARLWLDDGRLTA